VEVAWDDAPLVAQWPGLPPLGGDRTADACVVGLGGSGLAAVTALAARGLSVIGLDAGRVAAGAAGRNGGFLIAGPEASLHEAIGAWGVEAAIWLYRETLRELAALEAALGPQVVRRTGSIRLAGLPGDPESDAEAADRAAEVSDCAVQADAMRRHGLAVENYEGPLGSGLFLPDDAATNPALRAVATTRLLAGRATLHEHTPVHRVERGRVVTALGTVSAAVIVVAVDGRLEVLLPQLIGRVRSARLQMLATEPIATGRLPCPVYGRWGYDYAQQIPDGRILAGGGRDRFEADEWTTRATPTAPVQVHIEAVARRMAAQRIRVTHRWAASVGFTPDGRPLCIPVAEDVVACGGYNGTGNLVGPVAARAAVSWLLDATAPPAAFDSSP